MTRPEICTSIVETIGDTPLVELKQCSPNPGVRLFAKLEGTNPTGSVKDRIVKEMVLEPRRRSKTRRTMSRLRPATWDRAGDGRPVRGYNVRVGCLRTSPESHGR
jgi:hypothetical protein